MITDTQIRELISTENMDSINSIYWELPSEVQRIIDRMVAKMWNKDISELGSL